VPTGFGGYFKLVVGTTTGVTSGTIRARVQTISKSGTSGVEEYTRVLRSEDSGSTWNVWKDWEKLPTRSEIDALNSRRAIRYANTQGLTQTLYSALASRQVVTFSGGTCQLDLTETFAALNTNGVAACICSFSENTSGVITASLFTNSTKILSLWAKKVSDGSAFEGTVNINILVFFVS
jgi:hypothetical protein